MSRRQGQQEEDLLRQRMACFRIAHTLPSSPVLLPHTTTTRPSATSSSMTEGQRQTSRILDQLQSTWGLNRNPAVATNPARALRSNGNVSSATNQDSIHSQTSNADCTDANDAGGRAFWYERCDDGCRRRCCYARLDKPHRRQHKIIHEILLRGTPYVFKTEHPISSFWLSRIPREYLMQVLRLIDESPPQTYGTSVQMERTMGLLMGGFIGWISFGS